MPAARRPKYLEIRDDLVERIRRNDFLPGQALPSQARLSQDYGVTLMTLRQALRCLQDEDLIVQQRGRGTFVTPARPVLDLHSLSSLADDMHKQGVNLSTEVLSEGRRPMPKAAAIALARERGQSALRLERLRRIGRRVVVHQVSWIPQPWAEQLAGVDFASQSLYTSLRERCSLTIATADETLHARAMPKKTAEAVGVAAGQASMVAERTTYDNHAVPVVFDVATIVNDSLSIMARRTQRDIQLSWTAGRSG